MLNSTRHFALAFAVGLTTATVALAQEDEAPRFAAAVPSGAPMSFADLIEEVSPSVVSINARVTASLEDSPFGPDFEGMPPQFREWFERQFPNGPQQAPREGTSLGSGFFISADGYVVTNNHVVENASEITITTSDGEEFPAETVGTDPLTDLALLRVEADGEVFDFVTLDRDPDIRVGDWVVAVGNPFGLGGTATAGIVSATGRELPTQVYNNFLQIDAPINRGNSGGPTFSLNGEVIGVNSQIFSPSGGNVGIGFAIPSDVAAGIVDQLREDGRVARGWLGVSIQNVTEDIAAGLNMDEARGAIVSVVVAGGPADDAGFERGDVVLAIDGVEIDGSAELTRRVGSVAAGERVSFTVLRDGEERVIQARLRERPEEDELDQFSSSGVVEAPQTFFGMQVEPAGPEVTERLGLEAGGLVITDVQQGSEAAERGLRPGNIIREAGGRELMSAEDFEAAIDEAQSDGRSAILLLVQGRSGQSFIALQLDRV